MLPSVRHNSQLTGLALGFLASCNRDSPPSELRSLGLPPSSVATRTLGFTIHDRRRLDFLQLQTTIQVFTVASSGSRFATVATRTLGFTTVAASYSCNSKQQSSLLSFRFDFIILCYLILSMLETLFL